MELFEEKIKTINSLDIPSSYIKIHYIMRKLIYHDDAFQFKVFDGDAKYKKELIIKKH